MSSHFFLKHEADYSNHPNLVQYFIPLTDVEFRERLERHRGEIAIMLRSSEFNQDKATLIVTNNPLPLLISGQQLSTPSRYFSKDWLGRSSNNLEPPCLPPLRPSQKQLIGPDTWKLRKPPQFRFSTKNDFDGEANFSKSYTERRLQRMYPHLRNPSRLGQQKREPLPSIQGLAPKMTQWEPLTIACLAETKATVTAPGDDGFRYGKAPLWVINNSVVSKNAQ